MSTRIKLHTAAPKTRDELETIVGEITALKLRERALKAEMDAYIKKIKDGYQATLVDITESIAKRMPRVMAWAESNQDEFGKARSIELLHGTIGWRITPPTLKTLSGWTWDRVLDKITSLAGMCAYIRTKDEINKAALLADRDTLGADKIRQCGVRVIQDDEFFVEPKITQTEPREKI